MSDADKLILGIRPRDNTQTSKDDPADLVAFSLRTIPSDHRIIADFHIEGIVPFPVNYK
jgi:hypothetical protein